ncbi:MAG TPA: hypothetical protein PKH84_06995, partial [Thermomonas sp.]|uniref:hypothetical protein n=1 Tax=Thermomonas sp. TaxID=1971895 RepID=UPI002B5675FB
RPCPLGADTGRVQLRNATPLGGEVAQAKPPEPLYHRWCCVTELNSPLKTWVLEENRSWNEQYLLQAMLQHSARYEILFASYYAYERFPALVVNALNTPKGHGYGGSSMWLKVK